MIVVECQQGSELWLQTRAGVITASKYRDATEKTAKGAPTAKSRLYAAQVAIERISGQPCDEGYNSWQMKRGNELEPLARMEYESMTANLATESGIVLTDDRRFGYSTDGFINADGMLEIKCLVGAEVVLNMWKTRDMSEYMHQIQGGLWITGRLYCDFAMYTPQLANVGKQLLYQRVKRDDDFIEQLESDLMEFAAVVDENERVLRQQAA